MNLGFKTPFSGLSEVEIWSGGPKLSPWRAESELVESIFGCMDLIGCAAGIDFGRSNDVPGASWIGVFSEFDFVVGRDSFFWSSSGPSRGRFGSNESKFSLVKGKLSLVKGKFGLVKGKFGLVKGKFSLVKG